ncbi:MAG: type II toxin-antitoxin system PemK/MazF family toxin [Ferrimicrobium sp.]
MVIVKGGIYWADLGDAIGSRPVKRRPVLVVSSDPYNQSKLATVVAVAITTNTGLAAMPGNVFLPLAVSRLTRDSVVNVTALVTLNKTDLGEQSGVVPLSLMDDVERGLKRVLGL